MKAGAAHDWHCFWAGLAGLLLLATAVGAQEAPQRIVPFEGTQAFQHLLRLAHLKPLSSIAEPDSHDPREIVIVVLAIRSRWRKSARLRVGWIIISRPAAICCWPRNAAALARCKKLAC
jgi:hypothetical protein